MAALDLEEQEQLEALKAWWKSNGNWVLGGVLVAVVAIGGWRGWHYYLDKQAGEAASLYAEFTRQVEHNDVKKINEAAAAVMDKYPSTGYASRSALVAANFNEFDKDVARAKTQLQWVIDHASEASLKDVARLRLAAMLLDEKSYADAMKLVEAEHPASFDGLHADLKGDLLSAQGKGGDARIAYQLALDKIDSKSAYRDRIQMKLDALAANK